MGNVVNHVFQTVLGKWLPRRVRSTVGMVAAVYPRHLGGSGDPGPTQYFFYFLPKLDMLRYVQNLSRSHRESMKSERFDLKENTATLKFQKSAGETAQQERALQRIHISSQHPRSGSWSPIIPVPGDSRFLTSVGHDIHMVHKHTSRQNTHACKVMVSIIMINLRVFSQNSSERAIFQSECCPAKSRN